MKISDYLSKDEARYFASRNDSLAWRTVVITWISILAVFWLVDLWTNPLTIFLAIVLLAGRQLALAVIVHECGHHTLFRKESLNRFAGQWLAANVSLQDMYAYAEGHSYHQYTVRVSGARRDALQGSLQERGIGCTVYYPTPLHLQPALADRGYQAGDFPQAELASLEVLSLPVFPELTSAEREQVSAAIRSFSAGHSG